MATWGSIRYAFEELITRCSVGRFPNNRSGGVTHVGLRSGIRITVGNVDGSGGDDVSVA